MRNFPCSRAGCRSGADPIDGMENRETIDFIIPICGNAVDVLSHIYGMDSKDA